VSLVGIDVGSTSVKAAAFREDGALLALTRKGVVARHDRPGEWEVDAGEVWRATVDVIRRLAASPRVRRDPPSAVSISASGRESFPARSDGTPLGPCLRTADARRADPDAAYLLPMERGDWVRACGHVPDHMDPTNRLLWWRQRDPRLMNRARWFLGWHELLSLRMAGRPVVDPSLASGFLLFDLATRDWSSGRIDALGVDPRVLPSIVPWGTSLGRIRRATAEQLGLPTGCELVVGCFDTASAAVGAGAVRPGSAFVAVGSWESSVAPAGRPRLDRAASSRLVVAPYPSIPGTGLWARSPNGTVVVDWMRRLLGVPPRSLDARLARSGRGPSGVLVVPHLSGAVAPWPDALASRGAILGLTLATSGLDLVKGVMEGIACELTFVVRSMRGAGARVDWVLASGGGTRSAWWMQLKADLTGVPVDVPAGSEAGSLGAAILAGVGTGIYGSLDEAVAAVVPAARRFDPDPARGALYEERLRRHEAAVRRGVGEAAGNT
jgi:xylulokinase